MGSLARFSTGIYKTDTCSHDLHQKLKTIISIPGVFDDDIVTSQQDIELYSRNPETMTFVT